MTIAPGGAAELAKEWVSRRQQIFHGTRRSPGLPALSDESGT